jgi:SAM-dependent methyltransferase/uncharacterized protein YbaR (Trm112 family)
MRLKLLRLLCCCDCKSDLSVQKVFTEEQGEIVEGFLNCVKCGREFPIIGGVPRILPQSLMSSVLRNNAGFFTNYDADVRESSFGSGINEEDLKKRETMDNYDFEWNEFSENYAEWKLNFDEFMSPLKLEDFKDKLVLDVGCGFAPHVYQAAKLGAEVVGMDLSEAVRAAHNNTKGLENVHIVQGDVFNAPFKSEFDLVYSLGVLHHTPDPEKAFVKQSLLAKSGGLSFTWLYGERKQLAFRIINFVRPVTRRLPDLANCALSFLGAALFHVVFVLPYRLLKKAGLKANTRGKYVYWIDHFEKYPFRVTQANLFDWLSVPYLKQYSGEQVAKWLESAGLVNKRVVFFEGRDSWKIFGRRP